MKLRRLPVFPWALPILLLSLIFHGKPVLAQVHLYVDTLTNVLDADHPPFDLVGPGDTIYLLGGHRDYLLIRNFTGSAENPVIFTNRAGVVTINTDHYFGISVENCRYFRITGTGWAGDFYGFRIDRVSRGGGIGIGKLSTDFELDHCSIKQTLYGAIYAKTDPDCLFNSTREKFTQFNTVIHDNYIANSGNEGMYIGSSKFFGQTVSCNGSDTLLMPSLLNGVRIYNNILETTAWDGIQVSSASHDCRIYDNIILKDSQAEYYGQMAGILIGGGSKCDCYNNYISGGKGDGIESHGLGGYRIFNNVIEDAGRSYFPDDLYKMKYGIMVTDISVQADSSFPIFHNDILNPKSDGIRFLSIKSRHNLIASNAIINPGNYDFYENGPFGVTGMDSYVMEPDTSADLIITDNFFSRTAGSAGFAASGFALVPGSPLIDNGYTGTTGVTFDLYHHARPYGGRPDIGAVEFNPAYLGNGEVRQPLPGATLFPDPVREEFTLRFFMPEPAHALLDLYDLRGKPVARTELGIMEKGRQEKVIRTDALPAGIYLFAIRAGTLTVSGKFMKTAD